MRICWRHGTRRAWREAPTDANKACKTMQKPQHFALGEKPVRVECCGRRLARGRHRDLPALRVHAPAPLLVLVLLLVLAAATRSCSPCCASHRHEQMSAMCRSGFSAQGLGCQCLGAVRSVRPMARSPSARLQRPTGRPRVPNAGPAKVLALWPEAAPAPGRLAERVWHRQTRLDERFQAWGERPPLVIAVTSARRERAPLLLCSIHHTGACTTCACSPRAKDYNEGGGSEDAPGES